MPRLVILSTLLLSLAGCAVADRLANVGRPPRFSRPEAVPAPAIEPSIASSGQRDARLLDPYAAPAAAMSEPPRAASPSLFRSGAAGLFSDGRARERGDILTVRVRVGDSAAMSQATSRSRNGSEAAGIASLLGLDRLVEAIVPGKAKAADLSADSQSRNKGDGSITRSEAINMTLAAIVTDVLPNGNLTIRGRQELRVGTELRDLVITGIVRPQDISPDNSIGHERIAEARVLYGGRGQLTDAQQARYGQQIFDALFPF